MQKARENQPPSPVDLENFSKFLGYLDQLEKAQGPWKAREGIMQWGDGRCTEGGASEMQYHLGGDDDGPNTLEESHLLNTFDNIVGVSDALMSEFVEMDENQDGKISKEEWVAYLWGTAYDKGYGEEKILHSHDYDILGEEDSPERQTAFMVDALHRCLAARRDEHLDVSGYSDLVQQTDQEMQFLLS